MIPIQNSKIKMQKYNSKFKNKQQTGSENIFTLIGRALWRLISSPFRKKGDLAKKWEEVRELMQHNDQSAWAMAIVKADNVLDSALKSRSAGATLGERLKNMEGRMDYTALQAAWDGHKVRNCIAHDGIDLTKPQAEQAIANIRTALNELKEL